EDVLEYLHQSLSVELPNSLVVEIGGPDQVSYEGLMREYAQQRGLKRIIVPVPVLTPRLSSLWLGLVTPVFARTGRKLVESLRNPTVVEDRTAERLFSVQPRGFREAMGRALLNEDLEFAETRWSDSVSSIGEPKSFGGKRVGSRFVDSRTVEVDGSPKQAFDVIRRVGGKTGWYYADWLWSIRGFLDLLVGGVGTRRGRRHPVEVAVGDPIDYWRVEAYTPHKLLRLAAEMKLPGRAWLQFEVTGEGNRSTIHQTAEFDPVGLGGLIYWYGLYPFHKLIFNGMLRAIAREASSEPPMPANRATKLKRSNQLAF
ncbi:MAG TPA: SDR family oxidoreductase, partial [Acidobacteriota bacterium]|nr:SDR family oxidoreductase [Acidobacteriota bacterium]